MGMREPSTTGLAHGKNGASVALLDGWLRGEGDELSQTHFGDRREIDKLQAVDLLSFPAHRGFLDCHRRDLVRQGKTDRYSIAALDGRFAHYLRPSHRHIEDDADSLGTATEPFGQTQSR